ncbi:MAG TPA: cytochrome c3 family protein, partial [Blastocatellia bacterium]
MVPRSLVLTLVALFIVGLIVLALVPDYSRIRAGHADAGYLDSARCISCHTDHHRSWARTFHSRMTQEAQPETVQGDFEKENVFEYLGVKARMEKRGAVFTMNLTFPDGRVESHIIERTVGSRRIEQYVTRKNDQYIRLPLAYDLVNRRWMSLNGSFFHPDSDNYFQHQAQWDANCVFCHNVKAQPNFDSRSGRFKTEVAELGIACGACHGPAAAHAQEAASPMVRTLWRAGIKDEKAIIDPSKLTSERSLMICGHCHGQRVPAPLDRIQEILGKGDPYNAGEDLSAFYTPVSHETVLQSKNGPYSFANRFWANGSPRLTAYEYQGILRSACFTKGEPAKRINCLTCHSMHEGDIKGQIKEENRTNKPCLECHQKFETPADLAKHTGHNADSPASNCYTCHMPRVVYGIMSIHRTHDITIPDPQLTATQNVPNACNQCHLEKSVNWSINAARRLWPTRFAAAQLSADEQFDLPEGPRALFAGDALTRALAAEALGGDGGSPDPEWARPFLV